MKNKLKEQILDIIKKDSIVFFHKHETTTNKCMEAFKEYLLLFRDWYQNNNIIKVHDDIYFNLIGNKKHTKDELLNEFFLSFNENNINNTSDETEN